MIFGSTKRAAPYVDSAGNAWLPATEFVVRTGHHTDPVSLTWWTKPTSRPISNTPDAELYRCGVHAPEFWVHVTVAPGTYQARLRLAERRDRADPKRLPMSVRINGRQVVQALDLAEKAGGFHRALDLVFEEISPRNGIIEFRFSADAGGEAVVQALEVIPAGYAFLTSHLLRVRNRLRLRPLATI